MLAAKLLQFLTAGIAAQQVHDSCTTLTRAAP